MHTPVNHTPYAAAQSEPQPAWLTARSHCSKAPDTAQPHSGGTHPRRRGRLQPAHIERHPDAHVDDAQQQREAPHQPVHRAQQAAALPRLACLGVATQVANQDKQQERCLAVCGGWREGAALVTGVNRGAGGSESDCRTRDRKGRRLPRAAQPALPAPSGALCAASPPEPHARHTALRRAYGYHPTPTMCMMHAVHVHVTTLGPCPDVDW